MHIKFENSTYLSCIKDSDSETLNTYRNLANHTKANLDFQVGAVSYSSFAQKFEAASSTSLSTTASKVILCIARIASRLLEASAQGLTGIDSHKIKPSLFHARRDLQELYGRMLSVFHATWGEFHIQESQFQKSCYQSFDAPASGNAASGIRLHEYALSTEESRYDAVSEDDFKLVNQVLGMTLDQFVDQVDPVLRSTLTVSDLYDPSRSAVLKFGLLTDEEVRKLSIKTLPTISPAFAEDVSYVRNRFLALCPPAEQK